MQDPLEDLAKLTDAIYQAELGKMQALNLREAALRRDLAELEEHRRNSQKLPDACWQGARQIGADVLWQGWITRTRDNLNVQLAQVLAQKQHMLAQVRKAFGKQMAAAEMLEKSQNDAQERRTKKTWQRQDSFQILSSKPPWQ